MHLSIRPAARLAAQVSILLACIQVSVLAQEAIPPALAGTWRITRVLPAHPAAACWTDKQAQTLVGSDLRYSQHTLRWKGGAVPLIGITTRTISAADLADEVPRGDATISLAALGITAARVREVNLQHDDADITGATTEVPGDSVLLPSPTRLILSACGIFLEARRTSPTAPPPSH